MAFKLDELKNLIKKKIQTLERCEDKLNELNKDEFNSQFVKVSFIF